MTEKLNCLTKCKSIAFLILKYYKKIIARDITPTQRHYDPVWTKMATIKIEASTELGNVVEATLLLCIMSGYIAYRLSNNENSGHGEHERVLSSRFLGDTSNYRKLHDKSYSNSI